MDFIWDDIARDELADIWVAATPADRDVIEKAVLDAERQIKADPLGAGESRPGTRRLLILPPLTFWFSVRPDGSRVRVLRVTRRKSK
ncbi:MAG: hypothetical protein K2P78_13725 [Gemmataceae bacterium]|nr:hypothetical protein [Gemmataceae bacterium]